MMGVLPINIFLFNFNLNNLLINNQYKLDDIQPNFDMGLFDLFFRNYKKEEAVSKENACENSNDLWADAVTTGWEYTCNLTLITPKICIENDGLITNDTSVKPELFGEPNKLGKDGDPSGIFGF